MVDVRGPRTPTKGAAKSLSRTFGVDCGSELCVDQDVGLAAFGRCVRVGLHPRVRTVAKIKSWTSRDRNSIGKAAKTAHQRVSLPLPPNANPQTIFPLE
jgi:hypothetical protein